MLIINTEHYVRGLAAQGSTKIENGVGEQIVLLILQETTDRESEFFCFFREKRVQEVSASNWTMLQQEWKFCLNCLEGRGTYKVLSVEVSGRLF